MRNDQKNLSHFSKIIIVISILVIASLALIVRAQDIARSSQYKLEGFYEVQRTSHSQNLTLIKKENDQEEIMSQVKLVDQYLISDIPESEFLGKFSNLNPGFKELKVSIEVDQPLFEKENFQRPLSFLEKTKSLFGLETLPEYRLTKEINDTSENIRTNLKMSDLEFETFYRRGDGIGIGEEKIKQDLIFKNNSENEVNLQVSLTHSLGGGEGFFSFGNVKYLISENPQLLSPEINDSVSFSLPFLQRRFTYDFSDLLDHNPEIWLFKKDSENLLLAKIYLSIPSRSSITIDPSYVVDTIANDNASAYSFQRNTWWDGTRYWASLWEDTAPFDRLEFWYSTTGDSWVENTNARIDVATGSFSVIGDSGNAFVIYGDGTDIFARTSDTGGFPGYPGVDFDWAVATTIFDGSGPETYKYPHIARDSSNFIWATARYFSGEGTDIAFVVKKSAAANNAFNWGSMTTLRTNPGGPADMYGITVPRSSSQDMWAIWKDNGEITSKKYWNASSSWDAATTTIDAGVAGMEYSMSAVHDTTNYYSHLVYIKDNGDNKEMHYRLGSTSWSSSVALDSTERGVNDFPTISIDTSAEDLYAFWHRNNHGTYYIYYKKGVSPYATSGNWDVSATAVTSTASAIKWLSSNYSDSGKVYLEWTQANASDYSVRWATTAETGVANATPTVGTVILNGGAEIILTENTTTTVQATATVTDTNGFDDITSVLGYIYSFDNGRAVTDDNYCYYDSSCATSSCSGDACTATCEYEVWYHATPTDAVSDWWEAYIEVVDDENASGTATSVKVEVAELQALDISSSTINYGTISAGGDTDTLSEIITVTDTGNAAIDLLLSGTDLVHTPWSVATASADYKFSSSAADDPSITQIIGSRYLTIYESSNVGWAVVSQVNTSTWTMATTSERFKIEPSIFVNPDLAKIDDAHYLTVHRGVDNDGWSEIVVVNTSTWAISTTSAAFEFNTAQCLTPDVAQVDDTHYLVTYGDSSNRGRSTILVVNTSTWAISTTSADFGFSTTSVAQQPMASQIDDNHYLVVYTDTNIDGWSVVLEVNTSTWAMATSGEHTEFDTDYSQYQRISPLDNSRYLVAYRNATGGGSARVLIVSTSTWKISVGAEFEFDSTPGSDLIDLEITKIDDEHHLISYIATTTPYAPGISKILRVSTSTLAISTSTGHFEYNPVWGRYPDVFKIDDTYHLVAYQGTSTYSDYLVALEIPPAIEIPVEYLEYGTSSLNYGSGVDLTEATVSLEIDCVKPTASSTPITDDVFWGAGTPADAVGGAYTQSTVYTATGD